MPFLFRATPQHGNRQDGLIAHKPTERRQGILETTRRHPRRYEYTPTTCTRFSIRAICAARASQAGIGGVVLVAVVKSALSASGGWGAPSKKPWA